VITITQLQGHAYIDNSTVDEATGEAIGEALRERQARFLAAPVSGGWRDAAAGELLFIAGGDRSVFHEANPEFPYHLSLQHMPYAPQRVAGSINVPLMN
jgi:3-hydroxyisobutyrate dehydrogenase-like beta-hydroxyacid dehydrogenase